MYTWHEKHYVGAAHGIVGIIYMLLQVKLILLFMAVKGNSC